MQKSPYARFAPWSAALGLIALLVAAATYFVQGQFSTAVQVILVVGVIGLVAGALLNPSGLMAMLGARQTRYGANSAIMLIALIGSLGLVNYLAVRNPQRWDLTETQANTLDPASSAALTSLPSPVHVLGFYTSQALSQRDSTQKLLDRYRLVDPNKLTYEFIDPEADPVRTNQYGVTRDGTLVLVMGDQTSKLEGFVNESQVTGALVKLASPETRTVYFLTGQGEASLESGAQASVSQYADLLSKQNYTVLSLNLATTTTVPSDARAIVIAGPQASMAPEDVAKLKAFYDTASNVALVVLLDPSIQYSAEVTGTTRPANPLYDYLRDSWGVQMRDDVIIDIPNRLRTNSGENPTLFGSQTYGTGAATRDMTGFISVFFFAQSISTTSSLPTATYTPLVQTSSDSWGKFDVTGLSTGAIEPTDTEAKGPLDVGLSVEIPERKVRLIAFGDSDFASDGVLSNAQFGNDRLLLNTMNWATGDEALINLTPKTPTSRFLTLTDAVTINLILLFVVIIMPLSVLVIGVVVWFLRRRHK